MAPSRPSPVRRWKSRSRGRPRLPTHLQESIVVTFGLTALFLAVVGIYGVMAQAVGQRQQECGSARKGAWMRTAMTWNDATRALSISLAPGSGMQPPLSRAIEVRVAGEKGTRSARFTGKRIDIKV
jgi:hypothetical protein